MCDFEKEVFESLSILLKENPDVKIGAAVSGGADSISLLLSLCNIFSPLGKKIHVITVNHNIRPKEETSADAQFVVDFCENLKKNGKKVECFVAELAEGQVCDFAKEKKSGIEDAARFLRYDAFKKFCGKNHLDILCLAHNKNDNLETVLMRFLQGGNSQSLCGIPFERQLSEKTKICRPLLKIERSQIENYLLNHKAEWRTDSTNLDVKYLRNKIRLKLVPFLNSEFPGWSESVLCGMKKNQEDAKILENLTENVPIYKCFKKDDEKELFEVKVKVSDFFSLEDGIKSRVIIKCMNLLGEQSRIPSTFIRDFIDSFCKKHKEDSKDFTKKFASIQIFAAKDFIFFKKNPKKDASSVFFSTFFDIIEENGEYDFPFGTLQVCSNVQKNNDEQKTATIYINGCFCCENIPLPFILRSASLGDSVKTSEKSYGEGEKKVSDVFSDWHVCENDKKLIPVVQSMFGLQPILCILGDFLGYKNWIVK